MQFVDQTFLRSAQEPRLLAHLCQDPELVRTFAENRDPYATMCAPAFHKDYWECMEHWEDGSPNPAGKKMRKKGKQLMLGKPNRFHTIRMDAPSYSDIC